jgi:hypothetical protein
MYSIVIAKQRLVKPLPLQQFHANLVELLQASFSMMSESYEMKIYI